MSTPEHDKNIEHTHNCHQNTTHHSSSGCCGGSGGGGCCSSKNKDLKTDSKSMSMGTDTSSPLTVAFLRPGETVVDIGVGDGTDCFLAAQQVGPTGKVTGVGLNQDVVGEARSNAETGGYKNVDFKLGEISHLPFEDNSADVLISRCILNLSSDKQSIFQETYRILRKGGRLAISDVIGMGILSEDLKNDETYCSCISGAAEKEALSEILRSTGFLDVNIETKLECKETTKNMVRQSGAETYVTTAIVKARK
jgi:arsenite methyltransferase